MGGNTLEDITNIEREHIYIWLAIYKLNEALGKEKADIDFPVLETRIGKVVPYE